MANLLPPQSQKHLRVEYRARFLLVAALVVSVCAALALLALVPAEFAVISLPAPNATSTQSVSSDTLKDERAALSQAQVLMRILAPIAATPSLDPITSALALRSSGITIRAISYSSGDRSLVLQGTADTPDHLNAFRSTLQANSHFSNVSVPVGALIGNQNGGFTISMKVQP